MFSIRLISSKTQSCFRYQSAWSKSLLCAALILGLSGCGLMHKLQPYSIDIRQGNYVTQEMVAQLTPGMTEEQVRFIMGSPLLVDPFHANRWDYVYRFAPQGKVSESRRITLLFKDSKLSSVEGDVIAAMPAGSTSAPAAQSAPPAKP